MEQTIKSISGRWTFQIYEAKENVKSTEPTAMLITQPLSEKQFPFKVLGIYYVDNAKDFLTGETPFIINENEVILLLKHNYTNIETQLTNALKMMRIEFNAAAYGRYGKKL